MGFCSERCHLLAGEGRTDPQVGVSRTYELLQGGYVTLQRGEEKGFCMTGKKEVKFKAVRADSTFSFVETP